MSCSLGPRLVVVFGFFVLFFHYLRNEMDSGERERILRKSEIKFPPLTWTQTLNWLKLEAFEFLVMKIASHHFDVSFVSKNEVQKFKIFIVLRFSSFEVQ